VLLLKNHLSLLGSQNELDFLGRIQHPNIVSLMGFCIHEDDRFIIYDLMENGSLEAQLHGITSLRTSCYHFLYLLSLFIFELGSLLIKKVYWCNPCACI
jgi:serine/threonine protein kinase